MEQIVTLRRKLKFCLLCLDISAREVGRDTEIAHATISRFLQGKPVLAKTFFKLEDWAREHFEAAKASSSVLRYLSKPSAAEKQFLRVLHERMADGDIRCIVSGKVACDSTIQDTLKASGSAGRSQGT